MASDLHDRDIREPLFEFLEDSFGKIRILEEKTMGRSRVDIVMVTESGLTGIEIKILLEKIAILLIGSYKLLTKVNSVSI